jgi:hypothetical protein
MKINYIKTIIAIFISLLIAYGFHSFYQTENKFILSIGSFLFLSITLIYITGISFVDTRTTTNVRAISTLFFAFAFLSNFVFSFFDFSIPIYIIVMGIAILIHALITYSIIKVKK